MELGLSLGNRNSAMETKDLGFNKWVSSDPPIQLNLLPFSPVLHRQSDSQNLITEPGRRLEVNRFPEMMSPAEVTEEGATERDFSRVSDDEDNCLTRRKLRLSKKQSAFLDETFKQHITLNPKEKLALAKQLNLRPRQVEVWFQNRRARTKLKQTEVDYGYLKRCCETLTEENRRLQKEVQDLRALKTSQPYYNQLPATTLKMCPSCERVAATTNTSGSSAMANSNPILFPFANVQAHMHQAEAH